MGRRQRETPASVWRLYVASNAAAAERRYGDAPSAVSRDCYAERAAFYLTTRQRCALATLYRRGGYCLREAVARDVVPFDCRRSLPSLARAGMVVAADRHLARRTPAQRCYRLTLYGEATATALERLQKSERRTADARRIMAADYAANGAPGSLRELCRVWRGYSLAYQIGRDVAAFEAMARAATLAELAAIRELADLPGARAMGSARDAGLASLRACGLADTVDGAAFYLTPFGWSVSAIVRALESWK